MLVGMVLSCWYGSVFLVWYNVLLVWYVSRYGIMSCWYGMLVGMVVALSENNRIGKEVRHRNDHDEFCF